MSKSRLRSATRIDPAKLYLSPEVLAGDEGLSRIERILMLRQWERLERAKGTSAGDGRPHTSVDTLRAITEALAGLQGHAEPDLPAGLGESDSDRPKRELTPVPIPRAPQVPLPGPLDLREPSPRGRTLLALAMLHGALIGFLFILEAWWGAVALAMLGLVLSMLLMAVRRSDRER
jgi:hypothetical protein